MSGKKERHSAVDNMAKGFPRRNWGNWVAPLTLAGKECFQGVLVSLQICGLPKHRVSSFWNHQPRYLVSNQRNQQPTNLPLQEACQLLWASESGLVQVPSNQQIASADFMVIHAKSYLRDTVECLMVNVHGFHVIAVMGLENNKYQQRFRECQESPEGHFKLGSRWATGYIPVASSNCAKKGLRAPDVGTRTFGWPGFFFEGEFSKTGSPRSFLLKAHRLVVQQKGLIRVLHQLMEAEHGVVRLHHGVRHLRRRDHREGPDLPAERSEALGRRVSTKKKTTVLRGLPEQPHTHSHGSKSKSYPQ